MKQLKRHCENIYLIMLILAVPSYFIAYGASGHSFRLESDNEAGMITILFTIVVAILYLIRRRFTGKIIAILKILFGCTLLIALYWAIQVAWYVLNFNFGYDTEIFIITLSYIVPTVFIFSIINLAYWLFKEQLE